MQLFCFLKKLWWVFCPVWWLPTDTLGQKNPSVLSRPRTQVDTWGLGLHYGSVFAHSEAVQNTAGAHPRGIEISYTRQRRDSGVVEICNCYPRQGLVASYVDFDNEILGKSVLAGWMLEPVYRLGPKWQLAVRGIAGLAWMSNPYDSVKNPGNQSYSTALSGWLVVGLGISYPFSDKWRVQLSGNFQHTSNGGMKQPNKGVNWPTIGLHVQYNPAPVPFYRGQRNSQPYWKGQPWRKDIVLWGTGKRTANSDGTGTRQPIIGAQVAGSKQVGYTNALTAAAEVYYDGFTANRLEADSLFDVSAVRAGIMGGHEFLLGKFIFSQQIGVYLYNPSPYDGDWFHRWGLLYKVNKNWWAGINLKAHLQVADFIDFRLVYSWR